jgi:chemotaxis protein methyltransferase WspC
MDEGVSAIQHLLEERIGLAGHGINPENWDKILSHQMRITRIANFEAYYQLLLNQPNRLQDLIEEVIVPETWFFRDEEAYPYLLDYVKNQINTKERKKAAVRILCVPCSSGEEPYSIAMSFVEAELPEASYAIDGIDISKKALDKAEDALYTKNSFRNPPFEFQDRFFDYNEHTQQFILDKSIRDQVNFIFGNALDGNFMIGLGRYDIILCRNLLIYLVPKAQEDLIGILRKMLVPEGLLIVGVSEVQLAKAIGAVTRDPQRTDILTFPKKPSEKTEDAAEDAGVHPIFLTSSLSPVSLKKKVLPKQIKREELLGLLDEAKKLADRGLFDEAEKICLNCLIKHSDEAEAYFVLGMIEHARNNLENAEKNFSKSVYLNPNHYQSLIYLALLSEMRKDYQAGAHLRRRAEKVKKKRGL